MFQKKQFVIEARGEAEARKSLLLALICVAFSGIAGCRSAPVPSSPLHYVRQEALLSLHPVWSQIESFNRIAAGFKPPAGEINAYILPLPPPFLFEQTPPGHFSNDRAKRANIDEYLGQLTLALGTAANNRLEKEKRAKQREIEAQYKKELEQRIGVLSEAAAIQRKDLNGKIYRLGFTLVAYQSQARVFIGATQQNAKKRVLELQAQIAQLTAQRDKIPSDFRPQASVELKARYAELQKEKDAFVQSRTAELYEDWRQQIEDRKQQMNTASRTIIGLGTNLPMMPPPTFLPEPAPPDAAVTLRTSDPGIQMALKAQRSASDLQRERLLAVIRTDTEKAVRQIAEREGWQLVPVGTKRASDATEAVAVALRLQWRGEAIP